MSDTHSFHRSIVVPDGDVLIHCGDITHKGETRILEDFLNWFSSFPHKYKIFIAGNHDWCFEKYHYNNLHCLSILKEFPQVKYLHHEPYCLEEYGINIFGSPYTPFFCNWAFNIVRGNLINYWNQIPENTNILITHGPCYGILDENYDQEKCGDKELLDVVKKLPELKYHLFGHIHRNDFVQTKTKYKRKFINCSVLDENYEVFNNPVTFQYIV